MNTFTLSPNPIDPDFLKAGIATDESGALTVFEGLVRNHNEGRLVSALEYEAFAPLCQTEADIILAEASARFQAINTCCVHRIGKLNIGDIAVWVGVSAAHRDAAFKTCRYIIDEIKQRLPIWKKEYYTNGDSGWVNCTHGGQHAHDHKGRE